MTDSTKFDLTNSKYPQKRDCCGPNMLPYFTVFTFLTAVFISSSQMAELRDPSGVSVSSFVTVQERSEFPANSSSQSRALHEILHKLKQRRISYFCQQHLRFSSIFFRFCRTQLRLKFVCMVVFTLLQVLLVF